MSNDISIDKVINYAVIERLISPSKGRLILQSLITKDQAIKRIKDIRDSRSCDHLSAAIERDEYYMRWGAKREIMSIFDIKEEEL